MPRLWWIAKVVDDFTWQRSGAIAGVLFVVLLAIAGVIGGEPPAATDSSTEILQYLDDHETALRAGVWLLGLAILSLGWWFGALWRGMFQSERRTPLAIVSLIGLAIAGPLALVSAAVLAAAAAHLDDVGESATFVYELGTMLLAAEGFGLATHLFAANVLGARTRTLPVWLVVLGLISALSFLLSAVVTCAGVDVNSSLGLLAFVIWCLWILCVSFFLWTDTMFGRSVAERTS